MNDTEKIQSFGDMVYATERLTKPWRLALVITNILWAIVVMALVLLAYLTPTTVTQEQVMPENSQSQSYTEGATQGG